MEISLTNFLTSIIKLSEEEISLLSKKLLNKQLKKGDTILNKGDVCSSVYFIICGSLYEYYLDNDFNINVIDLYCNQDWVLNHKSFVSRKPSQYSIEAFEDSQVYELTIEGIHELIGVSQSFLKLGKILNKANNRLDFFDKNKSADEKYKYVLNNKPMLLQKFPLGMIASYLKISPETLSRVRNRIN
ncbi:Crp/Fnr family transcriptional regulator [Tenacibaculum sp. MEBiC06402]|uniref:Crp/Fnr family transcriptional regulator n=1 Tax=unclassified Tenacibaculum TaxID=2635139 RepID=UPI003B995AB4